MKQPKRPTLAQKKLMKENKLDWHNWMVAHEDNMAITVISKKSGRKRVLFKDAECFLDK